MIATCSSAISIIPMLIGLAVLAGARFTVKTFKRK